MVLSVHSKRFFSSLQYLYKYLGVYSHPHCPCVVLNTPILTEQLKSADCAASICLHNIFLLSCFCIFPLRVYIHSSVFKLSYSRKFPKPESDWLEPVQNSAPSTEREGVVLQLSWEKQNRKSLNAPHTVFPATFNQLVPVFHACPVKGREFILCYVHLIYMKHTSIYTSHRLKWAGVYVPTASKG